MSDKTNALYRNYLVKVTFEAKNLNENKFQLREYKGKVVLARLKSS